MLNAQLNDPPSNKKCPSPKPKTHPRAGTWRRPKLCDRLANAVTSWYSEEFAWYAGRTKRLDALSDRSLWHTDGFDPLPDLLARLVAAAAYAPGKGQSRDVKELAARLTSACDSFCRTVPSRVNMADYILIKPAGSARWLRARDTDLPNEAELQRLMKEHPETLPLDDLGDSAQPLLIVGRESLLGNGYADVIAIDSSGLVTVIECKLDRNPDVKRTVVGQVLGYGAYLWQLTYEAFEEQIVHPYFSGPACHQPNLADASLAEAMRRLVEKQMPGDDWSEQEFRQRVEDNLRLGRLRLVIVVDKVNDELRRTVEFLNNCTGPQFQCVCAELRHYASDAGALLVPTLIGIPPKAKQQVPGPRPRWTEEQFFADLDRQTGRQADAIIRELPAWCRQVFDWVSWGTGKTYPSFITGLRWHGERVATLFDIYPNGTVEVCFAFLKPYPPFTAETRRCALLDELNAIPGVQLPPDSFNRRPTFPLAALADKEAMDRFKAAFERVADELRKARDGVPAVSMGADSQQSPAPLGAG